jgi:hypothetical protein
MTDLIKFASDDELDIIGDQKELTPAQEKYRRKKMREVIRKARAAGLIYSVEIPDIHKKILPAKEKHKHKKSAESSDVMKVIRPTSSKKSTKPKAKRKKT